MILESAISTIATLIAAGYAAHKIENAFLARKGYDTRNFFKPDPVPAPAPTVAVPLWTEEDDRRQAQAFIDHPLAFWLDPNLFGDDPDWRERLFPAPVRVQQAPRLGEPGYIDPVREQRALTYGLGRVSGNYLYHTDGESFRIEKAAPPCPTCRTGRRMVLTDHGGEATSWACVDCDTEFTRAGETKSSRKRRKRLANRDDYDNELPMPPRIG